MQTLFSGLESAKNALEVSQAALNITSQNISNSTTTGYTRQRAVLSAVPPDNSGSKFISGQPQIGGGVTLTSVQQIRDSFLDTRYRTENSIMNNWDSMSDSLTQVEDIFNELSGSKTDSLTGLSGQMSTLLSDIKKLQQSPSDSNVASTVQNDMKALTQMVQSDYTQLSQLRTQIQGDLNITISGGQGSGGVNAVLKSISSLNEQIANYELSGQSANELRDQRNNLLDQLSGNFDIDVTEQSNGMVTVKLKNDGTHDLIDSDNKVTTLQLNSDKTAVQWSDGTSANVTNGTVAAQLQMINGSGTAESDIGIPTMENMLDSFAKGMIAAFNGVATGSDGVSGATGTADLLQGTGAADFAITSEWAGNASIMVTNYAGADTGNFVANYVNLFNKTGLVTFNGNATSGTLQNFTDSISGTVGQQLTYVNQMKTTYDSNVSSISNQRQEISGVSLDEEGTNIIKYSQMYNAAARVITTINDMLQTLIKETGVN